MAVVSWAICGVKVIGCSFAQLLNGPMVIRAPMGVPQTSVFREIISKHKIKDAYWP